MDYQALANLLFPNVTETPEEVEARFPARNLPEGAVVSRMAPSPTGFVHLGNLVQGTISERMSHQSGGVLFLRVSTTASLLTRALPSTATQVATALTVSVREPPSIMYSPRSWWKKVRHIPVSAPKKS